MNWYWYWEILMSETIITLIAVSCITLIIAFLFKLVSIEVVHREKAPVILKNTAEFFAIAGSIIAFTAMFSALIERMYNLLGIAAIFLALGFVAAGWIENR